MTFFTNWYFAQTIKMRAALVFVSVLVGAAFIFIITSWQMNRKAMQAMEPYNKSQQFINSYFDSLKRPQYLPETYFSLFKSQQRIMSMRKEHYSELSKIFFRNYYGILIITMLYSCVGGVILFLLINKGWSDASLPLKAAFLGFVMVLTFCGFFPLVFKQQENFNENIKMYMNYTRAEVNIIEQLSRLESPLFPEVRDSVEGPAKKPVPRIRPDSIGFFSRVDSMITVNNTAINTLSNYVLTIDATEVKNMGDIYRMIQNSTTGNGDTARRKPIP